MTSASQTQPGGNQSYGASADCALAAGAVVGYFLKARETNQFTPARCSIAVHIYAFSTGKTTIGCQ
jgi:hypothetical protein